MTPAPPTNTEGDRCLSLTENMVIEAARDFSLQAPADGASVLPTLLNKNVEVDERGDIFEDAFEEDPPPIDTTPKLAHCKMAVLNIFHATVLGWVCHGLALLVRDPKGDCSEEVPFAELDDAELHDDANGF